MAKLKRFEFHLVLIAAAVAVVTTADFLDGALRAAILGAIVGFAVSYEKPRARPPINVTVTGAAVAEAVRAELIRSSRRNAGLF